MIYRALVYGQVEQWSVNISWLTFKAAYMKKKPLKKKDDTDNSNVRFFLPEPARR